MRVIYSQRFRRSYDDAPPHIQQAFERRLTLLLQNLRHPSLRAKKYAGNCPLVLVHGV